MAARIDLNSDLGEGFGPWAMGDDAAMLGLVSSANIACGGHAGDPQTMAKTLAIAAANGVSVGAHPGYADREGFGRRPIPMPLSELANMVAAQVGSLAALAVLAGTSVDYIKLHGALGNLAAADADVATAIVDTIGSLDDQLAILAISGTELETKARAAGHPVFSEVFADRAYQPNGQLVPRSEPGAVLHDADEAADRLLCFVETGLMPVVGADPIPLAAHSICVHGDNESAVAMTQLILKRLSASGVTIASFLERR